MEYNSEYRRALLDLLVDVQWLSPDGFGSGGAGGGGDAVVVQCSSLLLSASGWLSLAQRYVVTAVEAAVLDATRAAGGRRKSPVDPDAAAVAAARDIAATARPNILQVPCVVAPWRCVGLSSGAVCLYSLCVCGVVVCSSRACLTLSSCCRVCLQSGHAASPFAAFNSAMVVAGAALAAKASCVAQAQAHGGGDGDGDGGVCGEIVDMLLSALGKARAVVSPHCRR
jgi:hypothetical protein